MNQQVSQQVLPCEMIRADLPEFSLGLLRVGCRVAPKVISRRDVVAFVPPCRVPPGGFGQVFGGPGCLSQAVHDESGPEQRVHRMGSELPGLAQAPFGFGKEPVNGKSLPEGQPVFILSGGVRCGPKFPEMSGRLGIDQRSHWRMGRGGASELSDDGPSGDDRFDSEHDDEQQFWREPIHFRSPPRLSHVATPPRRRNGGITCQPPAAMSGFPSPLMSPVATVTRCVGLEAICWGVNCC